MKWNLRRLGLVASILSYMVLAPSSLTFADGVASKQTTDKATGRLPRLSTVSKLLGDGSLVSARGQQIELYELAPASPHRSASAPRRLLVQGGLHGNETQTSSFVIWLAHRYARGESPLNALGDDVAIDFVPYANPDGANEQNRYNARGVNLNRNFEVLWGLTRENPGPSSFSEPETRAIRALFKQRNYLAAADVHGYINWVVMPSEPETVRKFGHEPTSKQVQDYTAWHSAVSQQMQLMPDYQLKTAGKLGDGGAFEDWAFWSEGTLALCLEMETFQRFVKPWRQDFNNPQLADRPKSVDLFKRYETFLARMFEQALLIRSSTSEKARLAVQ